MVAVRNGVVAVMRPSLSGLPPSPPPKNSDITQRAPSARWPASDSALMVPKGAAVASPGSASAIARRPPPIMRRIVSV